MNSEPVSAADLTAKLKREKTVEAGGTLFRIRRVPLMFLSDESEDFWTLARQGKEALSKRISELIANPKLPQFRRVLMHGVVSPKLSLDEGSADAVAVDLLLGDYSLAVGLYIEIINFTLDAIRPSITASVPTPQDVGLEAIPKPGGPAATAEA